MRLLLLVFLALFISPNLFAQHAVELIDTKKQNTQAVFEGSFALEQAAPFLSYALEWPKVNAAFEMRFSADGQNWSEWRAITQDHHIEKEEQSYFSVLQYAQAAQNYYQLKIKSTASALDFIKVHHYNPGTTAATQSNSINQKTTFACPCPQPAFENRADWCPAGDCTEHPSPSFTNVSHLIIHHSAGVNTSSDWAAVVRSIWDYHVNGRGWSDIGYNWLIAPTGVIYQGRGDNVIGAHFCSNNSNTMGVCMMGTYTDITPSTEATTSLTNLLAWKACDSDIEPLASSNHPSSGFDINHIAGHRDGCATECPGDSFYPLIPSIRQAVLDTLNNCDYMVGTSTLNVSDADFYLSPNPSNGKVNVFLNTAELGQSSWQLFNVHQQVVMDWKMQKNTAQLQQQFSIADLAVGVYFLQLNLNGKVVTRKLVRY